MHVQKGLVIIVAVLLLTGCASLSGIPVGLEKAERQKIAAHQDLKSVLEVSDFVLSKYEKARNDNLHYVFYSNLAFIPAAIAAAGGIYFKASSDFLAVTGIFAGALASTNTFINAKSNATVYQSGINALSCIQLALRRYDQNEPEPIKSLKSFVSSLEKEINKAQNLLAQAKSFNYDTKEAKKEIADDKTAIQKFTNEQVSLSETISKAMTALDSGNSEITAYDTLSIFAGEMICTTDQLVAAKISQPNVDFATLRDNITASIQGGATLRKVTGGEVSKTKVESTITRAEEPEKNISSLTEDLISINKVLNADILNVSQQIKKTGVIEAKTTAANCQKKIEK